VLTQLLDGDKTLKGWVQKKYLKPVAEDYPPQKSLAQRGDNFASSAMLIQRESNSTTASTLLSSSPCKTALAR